MAAALGLAAATTLFWPSPAPVEESSSDDDLPVPPVPPRIADGAQYDKCLAMLPSDPSGAYSFADTWLAAGGGDGAAHCQALAQVELGNPEAGAAQLDRLGDTSAARKATRAAILGQATQSWMMAGSPSHAFDSASHAIALLPDDPDLLVDRAIAASGLERFHDAVDDLSRALEIDQRRADALVLRAAAYRHLEQVDLAEDDIDRALSLDPVDPDALLERGILRQRRGDQAGARADWERAATLAPDTATGDLAQQNIALLDAGPERR